MGRPFELKYRGDLFLLPLKDCLKTSKKVPLVHWPDLWFLRFQHPTPEIPILFSKDEAQTSTCFKCFSIDVNCYQG